MSLFADLKVCLRFHDNCGKMIKLSNNHQTAQLTSRGGDFLYFFQDCMVISRDPMLTDMLYQVNETFSVCFSVSLSLSLCCCLSVSPPALCQTCIQSYGTVVLRFAGPPCQVADRATRFRRV